MKAVSAQIHILLSHKDLCMCVCVCVQEREKVYVWFSLSFILKMHRWKAWEQSVSAAVGIMRTLVCMCACLWVQVCVSGAFKLRWTVKLLCVCVCIYKCVCYKMVSVCTHVCVARNTFFWGLNGPRRPLCPTERWMFWTGSRQEIWSILT